MTARAYVQATMNAITAEPLAGGPRQESVSGARDRIDRMWSGAARTGRRRRCRRPDDDRRGAGHLQRDRDQRPVHVLLRADGHLNMPLSRPHITVDDLRIGWGARVLMEHVTFQVERGTIFAILGGSGCGKSSLLRYLIGLEQPQAGRIDIDGVGEPHRYEGVRPSACSFSRARSSAL